MPSSERWQSEPMKFSTFHLFSHPPGWTFRQIYDHELQIIRWGDELGFDTAWVAEHHFRTYGTLPNVLGLLMHLAGITRRIRLGTAVVIMPFHNPLRVAEDGAMVDLLSGGRLNFGFGRGYQSAEFAGFGLSMDDTQAKTDEAIEIVLRAWSGEECSFEGNYYRIPSLHVVPVPVQRPHPPLFVGSI